MFDPWIQKFPWRRKWQSSPVFSPGKSHGEDLGGLQSMGCRVGHDSRLSTHTCVCMCVLVTRSCLTLSDPVDYSSPGSSVHGILYQEYWSGLPFPSPGELPDPGIKLTSLALAGGFSITRFMEHIQWFSVAYRILYIMPLNNVNFVSWLEFWHQDIKLPFFLHLSHFELQAGHQTYTLSHLWVIGFAISSV